MRKKMRQAVLNFLAERLSTLAAADLVEKFIERGKLPQSTLQDIALNTIEVERFPEQKLRQLTAQLYNQDRTRHIFLDALNKLIKAGYPGVENTPFDLPLEDTLGFENLAGLFASTALDELIITMNIRQSAYLFGLIRKMQPKKVIAIGRDWGGSSLLIAAAMNGKGEFWTIDDPARLNYDIEVLGRKLDRPVEDQLTDVCERLGLSANVIVGDSRTVDVETGNVDLVFIDGNHDYQAAKSDFERFGLRARIGGAVLFDDAVFDPLIEPGHTADVKRLVGEIAERKDFCLVKQVKRLVHFERVS